MQVLIRMRPLSDMEKMAQGYNRCLKQESLQSLVWLGHPEVKFTFDHIVSETISQVLLRLITLPEENTYLFLIYIGSSFVLMRYMLTYVQEKLFRVAGLPMIDNCMSGYNSCMFAYGQVWLENNLCFFLYCCNIL